MSASRGEVARGLGRVGVVDEDVDVGGGALRQVATDRDAADNEVRDAEGRSDR